jgi:hypothetical protein
LWPTPWQAVIGENLTGAGIDVLRPEWRSGLDETARIFGDRVAWIFGDRPARVEAAA